MNRSLDSRFSRALAAALAVAALGGATLLPFRVEAQTTQDKIRLMADALRARNQGDLETARRNLEELIRIAPEDPNVQRLLAAVNDEIARRGGVGTSVPPTITPVTTASTPTMVPGDIARPAAPAQAEQAVAAAAADRRAATTAARETARDVRRGGSVEAAERALAAAPESARGDLEEARAELLLAQADAALDAGDAIAARDAITRYEASFGADRASRRLGGRLLALESDPSRVNLAEASPGFAENQVAVRELIARGRAQYLAGDYDGAQESFGQVEVRDPDNAEAKYFQTRIAAQRASTGALDREKTRQQMLQEVAQGWQRPQVFDREASAQRATEDSGLRARLEAIVIPRVNFSGIPLSRVIDTLSELSEQSDQGGGVNIVLINPSGSDPQVNITLRNLPLNRILDFVVESVGYEYDVTNDAVVVRLGSGSGTRMETDFFPLSRSTIIRLTGIGASVGAAPSGPANPFDPAPAPSSGGASGGEEKALRDFLQRAGVAFDSIPGANLALADGQLIVTNTPRNLDRVRNLLRRYNETKQVEIEAKFLEVAQGALDELGVNWAINNTRGGDLYGTMGIDGSIPINRGLSGAFSPTQQSGRGQIVVPQIRTSRVPLLDANGNQINAPLRAGDGAIVNGVPVIPYVTSDGQAPNATGSNLIQIPQYLQDGAAEVAERVGSTVVPVDISAPQIPGLPSFGAGVSQIANILGVVGRFEVEAVIRALSQQQGSDLMSAPKVTVLSGKTATITVAQEMRYPQEFGDIEAQVGSQSLGSSGGGGAVAITAGTPQDFTVRNVGVEMTVTPTVEEDNSISLAMEPKVTEFEGFVEYGGPSVAISGDTTVQVPSGFFQPIFSVRSVRTEVTIFDGATVVMGGLTREEVKTVKDKVPILGDLPMLGRLFRSEGESSQKRNLLIFVSANLISPGGSPAQQQFRMADPGSLFQNPTIVTPGGAATRGPAERR